MQLSNSFTVGIPLEEAWSTLLDLERVAPCLPGAAITDVDGDNFHGGVKIKVGPITAQYRGVATFVETDQVAHRAVISARGKDVGGQGNAEATIVATLSSFGDGTRVQVETDLDLSGRVAQFGRGMIGDVTGRLLAQFSRNLEAEITGTRSVLSGANAQAPTSRITLDDIEPLDVVGGLGLPWLKDAFPAVGVAAAVAVGTWLLRSRREATGQRGIGRVPVHVYLTLPAGHDDRRSHA